MKPESVRECVCGWGVKNVETRSKTSAATKRKRANKEKVIFGCALFRRTQEHVLITSSHRRGEEPARSPYFSLRNHNTRK